MNKRAPQRPTLYRKTFVTVIAAVAVVILAGGVLASRALERRAVAHRTQSLVRLAEVMKPDVQQALAASATIEALQPVAAALGARARCRVTVIDPAGRVLGDSEQTEASVRLMEHHRGRPEVQAALAGGLGTGLRYSTTVRFPMLYVALPLGESPALPGVLRLAVSVTEIGELRREIRRAVTSSLIVGLLLAVVLGAWLARRITRPLSDLTQVARAYATGDLTRQPPAAPVREVHELGTALGAMAEAIGGHIDALTTERNQARAILESMAEGVVAVDAQGRVLLMNPASRRLLGWAPDEGIGQRFIEIARHPGLQALARDLLAQRQWITKDLTLLQPEKRILRVHGVPCQGCGPAGPCAVLVLQDVTEHHRYEQLRREFVANVSHELKSPLTSIRGLTETLLGGAVDDAASSRRFVRLIDEDANRLSRLIDDLLSLSQIESQAVPVKLSAVELKPLVESVLASLQAGITQRRLTAACEVPAGLVVRADPDRLRQVLANLADNAVKYNVENGTITVSAVREAPWAKVTVSDTGVGIPAQDLPRIFERFYRVDKARSRELGGTGLGLSIVKHLVETHGGAVSVQSRVGHGAAFSFTIPLAS